MIQEIFPHWPWLLLAILIAFGIGGSWLSRKGKSLPYEKSASLLTEGELAFYVKLRQAIEGRWSIFSKVRLADLMRVKAGAFKEKNWQAHINQNHIDFVICDHETAVPKLAIELDDASHQSPERMARDQFVNDAFAAASLPLLRVAAQAEYKVDELKKIIAPLV